MHTLLSSEASLSFYTISLHMSFSYSLFFLLESVTHVLNSGDFQRKNRCLFEQIDSEFGLTVLTEVLVTFLFLMTNLSFLKLILWLISAVMNSPSGTWKYLISILFLSFYKTLSEKWHCLIRKLAKFSKWNCSNLSSLY